MDITLDKPRSKNILAQSCVGMLSRTKSGIGKASFHILCAQSLQIPLLVNLRKQPSTVMSTLALVFDNIFLIKGAKIEELPHSLVQARSAHNDVEAGGCYTALVVHYWISPAQTVLTFWE